MPRKSVVRLTDNLDMTIAVDWYVKPQLTNQPENYKGEADVLQAAK